MRLVYEGIGPEDARPRITVTIEYPVNINHVRRTDWEPLFEYIRDAAIEWDACNVTLATGSEA